MTEEARSLYRALGGDVPDGPLVYTYTPRGAWPLDLFDDPQTDAEWSFYDWWTENDAEEATAVLLGPDRAFTVTEWIGDDGAARVLGTEGEPTTPTMFVPLREETP